MPAIAPWLVTTLPANGNAFVTNDAAVGYNVTLSPNGFKPDGVAEFVDRSGGIALGYKRQTLSIRPPTKDSRIFKVSTKLFMPVLESTDPAYGVFGPKLAYEIQAHVDFLIPERATGTEKTAFWNWFRSMGFYTITASDGTPTDATLSPLQLAVIAQEAVY